MIKAAQAKYTYFDRTNGKSWKSDEKEEGSRSGGLFSFGKGEEKPFDWKPWLYAGGGGLLSFLAAKNLIGDDEDEKKSSAWQKLLPYLIGTAGALGGYALSKSGAAPDVVRYENDEQGNPIMPWKPDGTVANLLGWGSFLGSGAQGLHLMAGKARKNNEAALRYVTALDAEAARDKFKGDFLKTIKDRNDAKVVYDTAPGILQNELNYNVLKRRAQAEAKNMGQLNTAARDAVAAAGGETEFGPVRTKARRPAPAPKPRKGVIPRTPSENKYLDSLRSNAAKVHPVGGSGIVRPAIRKGWNAFGQDAKFKGGQWFNGRKGFITTAGSAAFGALMNWLGNYQNKDRKNMVDDFKRMGYEQK